MGCSRSAWLKDTADPVVRALEQRIAAVTGLDLRPPYAEYLQVVNYGLGGHYEPHFDHATVREPLGWSWGGAQGGSYSALGMVLGVILGWFLGWCLRRSPGWSLGRFLGWSLDVLGNGPWGSLWGGLWASPSGISGGGPWGGPWDEAQGCPWGGPWDGSQGGPSDVPGGEPWGDAPGMVAWGEVPGGVPMVIPGMVPGMFLGREGRKEGRKEGGRDVPGGSSEPPALLGRGGASRLSHDSMGPTVPMGLTIPTFSLLGQSRKSPLYRMKSGNRIATVMIYVSRVPPHFWTLHGHQ